MRSIGKCEWRLAYLCGAAFVGMLNSRRQSVQMERSKNNVLLLTCIVNVVMISANKQNTNTLNLSINLSINHKLVDTTNSNDLANYISFARLFREIQMNTWMTTARM